MAQLGSAARGVCLWTALACVAPAACTSDPPPAIRLGDRDGDGGTAGSPAVDEHPDVPWTAPGVRAYLEDREVVLEVREGAGLYVRDCSHWIVLEKGVGDSWGPLRDERPPESRNPEYYYLDGSYMRARPIAGYGCDSFPCREFTYWTTVGEASEYVITGTRATPAGSDTTAPMVDEIETVPFEGQLRVRLKYSKMKETCDDAREVALELTVPVADRR